MTALNPMTAMLPTLERYFGMKREPVDEAGGDAEALRLLAGMPGANVARITGTAGGSPFVLFVLMQE